MFPMVTAKTSTEGHDSELTGLIMRVMGFTDVTGSVQIMMWV